MDADWATLVDHQGYVAEVLRNFVSEPTKSATDLTTPLARARLTALQRAVNEQAQLVLGLNAPPMMTSASSMLGSIRSWPLSSRDASNAILD